MNSLKEQQRSLPNKPGVYIFLDKNECALYIGKAKSLIQRTKHYFHFERLSKRFLQMVSEAVNLKFHITENENEAFLLEAQLIKEKQPKYNIQYKNGRSLNYIVFSNDNYAKISIKKHWENGAIGPFLSYSIIQNLIQDTLTIFQIRTCTNASFQRRKRPCLEYYSKKCSAPCVQLISREEYQNKVQQMKDLFSGKNKNIFKTLEKEMKDHIKNERFELAAKLRDNINLLHKLQEKQGIFFNGFSRLDVILFYNNYFYIESIKNGAIINIEYRKYESDIEKQDILFTYYIENPKHKVIGIENIDFEGYSNNLSSTEVEIMSFAQTRFHGLLNEENALINWANIFNIDKFETIEAYDCSHYNSKFALCGAVRFSAEGEALKDQYKIWRYNKNVFNDLEILEYGLSYRAREGNWPDLILLDGGKTQLEVAKKTLSPFSKIIAYAKGENRRGGIIYNAQGDIVNIQDSKLLVFLEKTRQAAHNWAKKNSMFRFSSKY